MNAARRLTLTMLVSLCASLGCLALWSAPALAAGPPVVEAESEAVTDVTAESATFQAQIDPEGEETTYRFEYGTSEAYGSSVPVPDGIAGSGAIAELVHGHTQGLLAHTTYHYRVVAHSALGTVHGEDRTFLTQTTGGALALPDGRSWELVSPPSKQGALIEPLGAGNGAVQASADGDGIVYVANSPTETEPQGYAQYVSVLSTRGAGGWSSQVIAPPHNGGTNALSDPEYRFFSEDLSRTILQPTPGFTPLSPEATESTPYLRTDYLNGNVEERCGISCFQPLVTASNTLAGAVFGEEPGGVCKADQCGPVVIGASSDLSHVVITSSVRLTSTPAPPEGQHGLGIFYEWAAGKLQLLDVLPEGEEGRVRLAGSSTDEGARHAISEDGEFVILERGEVEGPGTGLYLRDVGKGETTRIDVPQAGGTGSGEERYMTASSDASRVFFLDDGPLTAESSPSGWDLYEYDRNAPAGSRLTDLTVDPNAGESAGVGTVIGASEDGSYVYFVAGGVLAEGAVAGGDVNLYVRHEGATGLVAALPGVDQGYIDPSSGLEEMFARVSPDGHWLAFMSRAGLTGYDTHDALSGQPDAEVYLYGVGSRRLVCASCNPTGARPIGAPPGKIVSDEYLRYSSVAAAANLPPWMALKGNGTGFENAISIHDQPRYLTDGGRLFFDSDDALVPQDVNGTQDVYEYEPAGVGSCSASSVTFGERSGGCVSLISSGASSEESGFLEASETGRDVFFLTTSQLAPQDADTAYDVYDAHECTDQAPCFPAPAVQPPPCTTESSCKAAPSPQPTIFGDPASATFSGAGNVVPSGSPPQVVVKPKSMTRAQKLARALHVCRKAVRSRRAACERKARKRYASSAGTSGKASAKRKGRG